MTTVLVKSQSKRYVFHNKFRKIFHGQKALSLNFKSSRSQMFFEIGVLKHVAIFTRKLLCWSCRYNKVAELQASNLEEHLRADTSVLLNRFLIDLEKIKTYLKAKGLSICSDIRILTV